MIYTTQCPDCQTYFKVSDTQLTTAEGLVRCGRCSHIFNAQDYLVRTEPTQRVADPPRLDTEVAPSASFASPSPGLAREDATRLSQTPRPTTDDFQLEVPFFEPDSPRASESSGTKQKDTSIPLPAAEPPPAAKVSASLSNEAILPPHNTRTPPANAAPKEDEIAAFQRALDDALKQPIQPTPKKHAPAPHEKPRPPSFSDSPKAETIDTDTSLRFDLSAERDATPTPLNSKRTEATHPSHWSGLLFAFLSVIGLLALVGQLVFFNRARIATEVPELRPALERTCQALGCQVPLPMDLQFIRTEWSDCPQLPDRPNLLQLQAKVKNRAPYPQTWPMMELTLKDGDDQVLIRKIITPKEYLKLDDYKLGRFNANSETRIDMLLDVGQVRPHGYSIYWFYP